MVASLVTLALVLQDSLYWGATISAMPFSPSDLPWWGWLLCSLGAWVVAAIFGGICSVSFDGNKSGTGCFALLVAVPAGLIGAATGVMGVILFIKWVWVS